MEMVFFSVFLTSMLIQPSGFKTDVISIISTAKHEKEYLIPLCFCFVVRKNGVEMDDEAGFSGY